MGAIAGNTPVKPCALFCGVGGINCIDDTKRVLNACMGLYCSRTKQKPCTVSDARRKKSPAIADRVKSFISAIQSSALCVSILPAYNLR